MERHWRITAGTILIMIFLLGLIHGLVTFRRFGFPITPVLLIRELAKFSIFLIVGILVIWKARRPEIVPSQRKGDIPRASRQIETHPSPKELPKRVEPEVQKPEAISRSGNCMVCQQTLSFDSKISGGLYFGDQLADAMIRTAYKCRNCGSLACMRCAQNSRCTKCGGNTFDSALS